MTQTRDQPVSIDDTAFYHRYVRCVRRAFLCGEDYSTGDNFDHRKSQALLDETALLSCMAYVDLYPIRAGIENDVVNSDFTFIQQRLFDYVKRKANKKWR